MQKSTWRYWVCQIFGWGGWSLLNLFFVYLFAQDFYLKSPERRKLFFAVLIIQFIWYILSTHLLRLFLKKINWINFKTDKVILFFIAGVAVTGLLSYYGSKYTAVASENSLATYEKTQDLQSAIKREKDNGLEGTTYYLAKQGIAKDSTDFAVFQKIKQSTGWYRDSTGKWQYQDPRKARFWWDIIFNFILIALWLLIYMVWHYLVRNQKDQLDKIKLAKTVQELELKTIKSHINPHFIFNSLNSIRALVEENPRRARTAITELSNILRSSLQVEKMETVPLERELSIVKDYLALEQMRFEERLKVTFDIDPKTLELVLPPMMLQTLVENAIKHGINKRVNGGVINITSRIVNHQFEIIVENTGSLEKKVEDGFGFTSTRDRLKFLYNGKARFTVEDKGGTVRSIVLMPMIY